MKPTIAEAKAAKTFYLSLEECLDFFDERLLQCQEYTRMKVKQELDMKEMSKNVSKQIDGQNMRQRSQMIQQTQP
jgi:hypothetical protein